MNTIGIRSRRWVGGAVLLVLMGLWSLPGVAVGQVGPSLFSGGAGATSDEAKVEGVTTEEGELPGNEAVRSWITRFETNLPGWALHEVLGFRVWQVMGGFFAILLGMVLKKISDYIFKHRLVPLFEKTKFQFDNLFASAAAGPLGFFWLILGFDVAFIVLHLPTSPDIRAFAFGLIKIALAADALWFLFRLVDVAVEYLGRVASGTDSKLDDQLVPLVRKSLKALVGVLVAVWTIQLLGYSVTSLVAGLGLGGLAVALALQDTLANFFGSIFIFIDRPFAIGERIRMGGVDGFVEEIGFRSTRIRTLEKSYVSVPNKTVSSEAIDNWTRLTHRRVFQTVGVTYETTADQMEEAVRRIEELLDNDDGVDKEYYLVKFEGFGDSSLNIWLYYFTDPDWGKHLEVKQRINLAVMRILDDMGLAIAFPTRTLYFEGDIAKALAERGVPDSGHPPPPGPVGQGEDRGGENASGS